MAAPPPDQLPDDESPRFAETLPLPGWVRALGGGIILVLAVVATLVAVAAPRPLPTVAVVVTGSSVLLGGAAGVVALMGRQETTVHGTQLQLRLAPVWRRDLEVDDLQIGGSREVQGLEFGGFGVRRPGDGTTVLIANPGSLLEVTQREAGTRFLIRTDRPDELASALTAARDRSA